MGGVKARQIAGLMLPAYLFIPPQVPLTKRWGALLGGLRGKRGFRAGEFGIQVRRGRKTLRITGNEQAKRTASSNGRLA